VCQQWPTARPLRCIQDYSGSGSESSDPNTEGWDGGGEGGMEGLNERQESMREVNAFLKRQQPRKKTVKISPEHRSKYMESRARLSEQMKGVPQSEETKRCLASFLLTSFLNA
jgi:hypothetical protein